MAITIIKNTMVDPVEMTCDCCKSVFTYNFEDIQRREESMFLGMSTITRRYITCPVCKYDNDLTVLKVVEKEDKKEEEPAEPEEKSEEEEETYCTNCPYFEDVVDDTRSWYGGLCKKDGHESAPSMYAIQSLHKNCPLKKEKEVTDEH